MKICIPTETNHGKTASVFGHFGSAPFFTIYDTDSDACEVIDNGNQHHSHGMCQPMSALAGKQISAVVTGGAGARAIQKLNESGIRVFRSVAGNVSNTVDLFKRGQLEELSVTNACSQHDCHH